MFFTRAKRLLLGQPISTHMETQERIPKWKALAVLSSDALSSIAYATEEILIPLAAFGMAAMAWSMPIALAIGCLLAIVAVSYRQTIDAYPGGGGAYFVAKDNLGINAGLVAGAALLIDYTLTVAVSVAAGVENMASAFPFLVDHKEAAGAAVIFLIMLFNLRGVRESAAIFALPTYFFLLSFLLLILVGAWKALTGEAAMVHPIVHETYPAIPMFLLLRAFSSGCSALTGVEAISDSVGVFRQPAQRNAKATLAWMAALLGFFFISVTCLAHYYGIMPQEHETVVSQLARAVFGQTGLYYAVQFSTALILVLAANTAYADFPRLSSFLAKDRYLPRQLAVQGDRLVFSNGILGLSLSAVALIVFFKGDTHALLPLYAFGVFLSFTLSQGGMIVHHLRKRDEGWARSLVFNSVGCLTTFVVMLVIASTKFLHGAWVVILLIPCFVVAFRRINTHYLAVGKELSLTGLNPPGRLVGYKHTVIVPISGVHQGVISALRYAISISDDVRAVYVEIDQAATERMKVEWDRWAREVPLIVLRSPYRSVIRPLLEYLDDVEKHSHRELMTVVIPEFVTSKWRFQLLHNQTALLIRAALMFKRRKIVTSVRYHLKNS